MGTCGDEIVVSGIDEAGRGSILGNLFIALVETDNKTIEYFKSIGVKDSKLLTDKRRTELAEKIRERSVWAIASLDPQEIDNRFSNGLNLNSLEAVKYAELINKIKPKKVIIDCPSPNIPAFKKTVEGYIETKPELVLEHKADLNHVIVSAASVLAKDEREKHIKSLSEMCGVNLGSGYPSDPVAMKGVNQIMNTEFSLYIRKSWMPYLKIREGLEQKKLGDFR